jgi:hypothetical protein
MPVKMVVFKEIWTGILASSGSFHKSVPHAPQYPIGAFSNFYEICKNI